MRSASPRLARMLRSERKATALEVTPDGVVIAGGGGPGMFYGMQTLLQLMPPQVFSPAKVEEPTAWTVPAVQIKDQPRFRWRGLLLDVSRHFFNKQEIENFIGPDGAAQAQHVSLAPVRR